MSTTPSVHGAAAPIAPPIAAEAGMEVVRVVQDPAHPLSDTPASFTGVLVEPFEVSVLCSSVLTGFQRQELDRRMSRVILRTDCGRRVEAEMSPQFELAGDWQLAVDHRELYATDSQLRRILPQAMRTFVRPGFWRRTFVARLLWTLTIPVGTRVRVERFDAYAELRAQGDYRTARTARVRVRSHRLVVVVDRPVSPDALEPLRPLPPPFGLIVPIALGLFPTLALVSASAGFVEPGRWLAYSSLMFPAGWALLFAAFEIDMRRLNRRLLAQEKEPPSGPPKLC